MEVCRGLLLSRLVCPEPAKRQRTRSLSSECSDHEQVQNCSLCLCSAKRQNYFKQSCLKYMNWNYTLDEIHLFRICRLKKWTNLGLENIFNKLDVGFLSTITKVTFTTKIVCFESKRRNIPDITCNLKLFKTRDLKNN